MTNQHSRQPGRTVGKSVVLTLSAIAMGVFILSRSFGVQEQAELQVTDSDSAADADTADDTAEDDELDSDDTTGDSSEVGTVDGEQSAPDGPEDDAVQEVQQTVPLSTRPPESVKVATVNGARIQGLAGATSQILIARGYVAIAKNAASPPVEKSSIFYRPGYSDDAKAVAATLSAPADIISPTPDQVMTLIANPDDVAEFNIFVVLGVDGTIPVNVQ